MTFLAPTNDVISHKVSPHWRSSLCDGFGLIGLFLQRLLKVRPGVQRSPNESSWELQSRSCPIRTQEIFYSAACESVYLDTPTVIRRSAGRTSPDGRVNWQVLATSWPTGVARGAAGGAANTSHADKDVTQRRSMTSRQTRRHVAVNSRDNSARGVPRPARHHRCGGVDWSIRSVSSLSDWRVTSSYLDPLNICTHRPTNRPTAQFINANLWLRLHHVLCEYWERPLRDWLMS